MCQCLYLADLVGNRKDTLLERFNADACTLLGCCGTGQQYWTLSDHEILTSLLETVQQKLNKQIEEEGKKWWKETESTLGPAAGLSQTLHLQWDDLRKEYGIDDTIGLGAPAGTAGTGLPPDSSLPRK